MNKAECAAQQEKTMATEEKRMARRGRGEAEDCWEQPRTVLSGPAAAMPRFAETSAREGLMVDYQFAR